VVFVLLKLGHSAVKIEGLGLVKVLTARYHRGSDSIDTALIYRNLCSKVCGRYLPTWLKIIESKVRQKCIDRVKAIVREW